MPLALPKHLHCLVVLSSHIDMASYTTQAGRKDSADKFTGV